MKRFKLTPIIGWIARIWGGLIVLVVIIASLRGMNTLTEFENDWKALVLKVSLFVGLLLAYKWKLIGGVIATIGIIITGFFHPLVLAPGLLYIIYGLLNKAKANHHRIDSNE